MKVVDIRQRTPEWHAWRQEGLSASHCATIMGQNPQVTRLKLWRMLVGIDPWPDLSRIPQVRRGVKLEPLALQAFEDKYGKMGLPICGEMDEHPFIRASFDGLLADGSPVEIKNLSESNHLQVLSLREKSDFYQLYRWQVMHQLIVSGGRRGYLWFWSPKHEPVCLVVDRDDLLVRRIIEALRLFWELVATATPPEADPKRDLIPLERLNLPQWRVIALQRRNKEAELAKLKLQVNELKAQLDELDIQLVEHMGDFHHASAFGVQVTRFNREGPVNWRNVAEELAGGAVPFELVARHQTDSTSAVRVTVDLSFDESKMQPEPTPRVRRLAANPGVDSGDNTAVNFWF